MFDEKYDRRGPDECWPWTAATNGKGYGVIRIEGRLMLAHRLILEEATGTTGKVARHYVCDNPPCVNPAHLRWGTQQQNQWDSVDRDRAVHPTHKDTCVGGHEMSEENTRVVVTKTSDGRTHTAHVCRACQRRWQAEYRNRKRKERR